MAITDNAMEQQAYLQRELIAEPQLWRLALRVEKSALEVVLYSTIEENSLIYRHIPLVQGIDSHAKALEEAVYENPLLLSDFSRIDCVIDTDRFVVVPAEIDDPLVQEKILKASFPEFDGQMIANTISQQSATILMGIDDTLLNFIRRTFNNPRISHYMSPLCRYFIYKSRQGNASKMYAHLRDNSLDLMVFANGTLRLANTFTYREPIDAVYYIMACRQQLSLDSADMLYVLGNGSGREEIVTMLREHIANVMPEVFPSEMFRAGGRDAMRAPFDLIVLPLCE